MSHELLDNLVSFEKVISPKANIFEVLHSSFATAIKDFNKDVVEEFEGYQNAFDDFFNNDLKNCATNFAEHKDFHEAIDDETCLLASFIEELNLFSYSQVHVNLLSYSMVTSLNQALGVFDKLSKESKEDKESVQDNSDREKWLSFIDFLQDSIELSNAYGEKIDNLMGKNVKELKGDPSTLEIIDSIKDEWKKLKVEIEGNYYDYFNDDQNGFLKDALELKANFEVDVNAQLSKALDEYRKSTEGKTTTEKVQYLTLLQEVLLKASLETIESKYDQNVIEIVKTSYEQILAQLQDPNSSEQLNAYLRNITELSEIVKILGYDDHDQNTWIMLYLIVRIVSQQQAVVSNCGLICDEMIKILDLK